GLALFHPRPHHPRHRRSAQCRSFQGASHPALWRLGPMRYERFPPSPGLADYVEHFWLIEADLGERRHEEILVPNGRPTLLLSLGDEGWRKDPHTGGEEPNCSGLTGIATGPVLIGQTGQVHLVAAQLSPFGPAALGLPCAIDRHMALDTLPDGAPLLAGIRAAGISRAAVERLDTMLLAHQIGRAACRESVRMRDADGA